METSLQDSLLVAFPNLAINSQVNVALSNELQSLNYSRDAIFQQHGRRVDLLLGYRYSRFAETLAIDQQFTVGPASQVFEEGTIVERPICSTPAMSFTGLNWDSPARSTHAAGRSKAWPSAGLGWDAVLVIIGGETITTIPGEPAVTTEVPCWPCRQTSATTPRAALLPFLKWASLSATLSPAG